MLVSATSKLTASSFNVLCENIINHATSDMSRFGLVDQFGEFGPIDWIFLLARFMAIAFLVFRSDPCLHTLLGRRRHCPISCPLVARSIDMLLHPTKALWNF